MSRKPRQPAHRPDAHEDAGFQDKLLGMLEWVAERDPVRAARLIGRYLDELAREVEPRHPAPAKS